MDIITGSLIFLVAFEAFVEIVRPIEQSCERVYFLFELVVVDVFLEAELYATPLWQVWVVLTGYGL